ncbi:hypothetical protein [Spirosoma jeollabukense]
MPNINIRWMSKGFGRMSEKNNQLFSSFWNNGPNWLEMLPKSRGRIDEAGVFTYIKAILYCL